MSGVVVEGLGKGGREKKLVLFFFGIFLLCLFFVCLRHGHGGGHWLGWALSLPGGGFLTDEDVDFPLGRQVSRDVRLEPSEHEGAQDAVESGDDLVLMLLRVEPREVEERLKVDGRVKQVGQNEV